MPSTVTLYTPNILEDGTVTVTGTADTGFPEARLYDRTINLYWKDTVTEAKDYKVDQGASGNIAVDFLAIPKHNLNGQTIEWQWSTDDASYTDAVTDFVQGDNNQIIKTISTSLTKRYWQVTVDSMANPKISEIFMSLGYTFNAKIAPPRWQDVDNVQWNRTVGGITRNTKKGNKKRTRNYVFRLSAADIASFRTAMGYLDDYTKPFYIKDHEDNYFMCRFTQLPVEDFSHKTHVTVNVDVIEEL